MHRAERIYGHVAAASSSASSSSSSSSSSATSATSAGGYELVELTAGDAADCVGVAGGSMDASTWRSGIEDADRTWGHRRRSDGLLVSTTTLYCARGADESDTKDSGHCTVANVITNEAHRRCGLAKALMLELLRAAGGRPTSLFASEMGRPLYQELGFRTVEHVRGFQCERAGSRRGLDHAAALSSNTRRFVQSPLPYRYWHLRGVLVSCHAGSFLAYLP